MSQKKVVVKVMA